MLIFRIARTMRTFAAMIGIAAALFGNTVGVAAAIMLYLCSMSVGLWQSEQFIMNILKAADRSEEDQDDEETNKFGDS